MRTKHMRTFRQMKKNILHYKITIVMLSKAKSNYRAHCSQNMFETGLFKFTILVL